MRSGKGARTPVSGEGKDPARALRRTWQAVLGRLELEVSRANFETWLAGTTAHSLADGELVVEAASAFRADWLNDNLAPVVERCLGAIEGERLSARFVAPGTATASDPEKPVATPVTATPLAGAGGRSGERVVHAGALLPLGGERAGHRQLPEPGGGRGAADQPGGRARTSGGGEDAPAARPSGASERAGNAGRLPQRGGVHLPLPARPSRGQRRGVPGRGAERAAAHHRRPARPRGEDGHAAGAGAHARRGHARGRQGGRGERAAAAGVGPPGAAVLAAGGRNRGVGRAVRSSRAACVHRAAPDRAAGRAALVVPGGTGGRARARCDPSWRGCTQRSGYSVEGC